MAAGNSKLILILKCNLVTLLIKGFVSKEMMYF
jgi:hypothetical protein